MSDRPKVSLRPFEAGDAPAVHRWFNNEEATRTLMEQRASFSLEEAEGWVARAADQSGEDRKFAISLMAVHLMFWFVLVMIGTFFRGPGFLFTLPWVDGIYVEL